ncbi:MAG: hypothetical protein QNJ70_27355 [Xenococcaceae cyanobacterium MO_207.B15]|nr:hypothetical protein [Xenococcaceae cyanobacterium MO_207.B15]
MKALPKTTKHRLKKIPQNSSVWEGDRCPLAQMASHLDENLSADGECVIWIDGSEGSVRAMDVVTADSGLEVVARTLLRAMEDPHPPSSPARPKKIVVRDREIQFFLRGVLQGLDINIEYARDLPFIDQLFQSFQQVGSGRPPALPPKYDLKLQEIAEEIWHQEPWNILADSDILSIKIDELINENIYVCVMGMMSAEYGVLLYRSLDSLQDFRKAALREKSVEELEQAFLAQDCWFLNYEEMDAEDEELEDWDLEAEDIHIVPFFGSLHPLEGMRTFLDEEEAKIVHVALEAILQFCRRYHDELARDNIPQITESYKIPLVSHNENPHSVSVEVSTLPELTAELLSLDSNGEEQEEINFMIEEDLVPEGSLVTLGSISWELAQNLKNNRPRTYYQALDIDHKIKNLPAILIQTSRPKAKNLIDAIKELGGLKTVCFNPGNDPFSGDTYDLGMLQTGDGSLHIFAEYPHNVPRHAKALESWYQNCEKTKGYCSLIITMGVTGANRGNPQPKDMLAVFEAKAIAGSELGMGVLQLMPSFDLE